MSSISFSSPVSVPPRSLAYRDEYRKKACHLKKKVHSQLLLSHTIPFKSSDSQSSFKSTVSNIKIPSVDDTGRSKNYGAKLNSWYFYLHELKQLIGATMERACLYVCLTRLCFFLVTWLTNAKPLSASCVRQVDTTGCLTTKKRSDRPYTPDEDVKIADKYAHVHKT